MLIQVTNDQGIYRKRRGAFKKWQVLVLSSPKTGAWSNASSAAEPSVKIQAHSKSSTHVQVSLNELLKFKDILMRFYFRFVILKAVQRKDLIETLPLPRRLLDLSLIHI